MGWLLLIVVVLILVVGAVLVLAARRPDTFTVSRHIRVKAPASAIYPLVADFRQWALWSPYERLDPNLTRRFSGAESGLGAVYAYQGNNKVGAGRMEITEARASERVGLRLDFFKPMKATNSGAFTFAPREDGTEVTWSMAGKQALTGKLFGLVMDMDKLVGTQFEQGLAALKAAAEAESAAPRA